MCGPGKASQEQFNLYCKIVEILVKDFGTAFENQDQPKNKEILHHLRLELHIIAGNPYHTLELWAPFKKDYESQQKWSKAKASSDGATRHSREQNNGNE